MAGADPGLVIMAVLGVIVSLHIVLLTAIAVAVAVPNPFKRIGRRRQPEDVGLQAERFRLPDGSPAWYIPHATAHRTVLVCHGRSRSKSWMLPLIARLAERYHVLAFDFPGHGDHEYGTSTVGAREADTVDAALDWLASRGAGDVVVYGVSMGGAAALIALGRSDHPHVRGLVTDGTFDALRNVFASVQRTARVAPRWYLDWARLVARATTKHDPYDVRPIDSVGDIAVPMLFLHGTRDPLVPPACAKHLEAAAGDRGVARFYRGFHDKPRNTEMQDAVLAFVADPGA